MAKNFMIWMYENFIIPLYDRASVFFKPSDGLFIGYLVSALIIAVLFYAYSSRSANLLSALKAVIGAHSFSSRSVKDDLKLFIFDKIFLGFIYSFVIGAAFLFRGEVIHFLSYIGMPTQKYSPGIFLSIILTLLSLLVFDFAVFLEHYLSHKVLFLWEFHEIHHIAEELNPLTAYRSHPVNQCCFILMVSLFSGTYSGIVGYFFDSSHAYILFAGQNVFMFILLFLGLNLQHSRIFLRYPKVIRSIFISPAYHQLHHSSDKKHFDINFGFIFAFWDKIFKTQLQPSHEKNLTFGVNGEIYENYAGIKNSYITPFKKAFFRIKRKMMKKSVVGSRTQSD
ncbi:sterol desaturase family protein [Enterobacter hormaechei]|uniref:sterol desaturase family protein n=1 Tax=Enterobacter hormaechei TaxID=158836 RepID=UPI0013D2A7AC|nr:sterol desaturase family protein [Enterobacter hormaechei]EKJ9736458.1 sterol desaturase family protein [Salmonella enterica]NGF47870.1 sterol desaturase family protein [Enterobacter hormaechei]